MKKLAFVIGLAVAAFAISAVAANQQVDPDTYRRSTTGPWEPRADGLIWEKESKAPRIVGNGDGFSPIGPTYFDDFGYGDGVGVLCEQVFRPDTTGFNLQTGSNTACDTTCAQGDCVIGFDTATELVACSDAAGDSCLCLTSGLDVASAVCGANWEAPALGSTMLTTAHGTKLVHTALTEQLIGPDMDADGLDIGGDQENNDGAELVGGMYGASGRPMYPNFDPAFQFCVTASITDVSGTDTFWIGFRSPDVATASHTATTIDAYTDFVAIGFDNTSADWHTTTCDGCGGTETTTDVTLDAAADDTVFEACVYVSDAGAVTYSVDGATPTDAVAATLSSGEGVVPFVYFLNGSALADEVIISRWEVAYQ